MSASASSIRGSRVGSASSFDHERGDRAEVQEVSFYCANGHVTLVGFAAGPDVEVPRIWACRSCGFDAGQDQGNPPAPPTADVFKSHLEYVKERRSPEEGRALLDEALERSRRGLRSR